ncbi:MAG: hypothetical protein LH614_06840 [Pyrinomonadaceae bacterium]|nr:hypothetical protein [Pyrinomonadaceae bacterium]
MMNYLIKLSFAFVFLSGVLVGCANAQTVDLSTKEAVLEQLGKLKNKEFNRDKVCIERLKESANIIVVGFFAYDRGCRFDGVFVNSVYFEKDNADLSKNALNALGWKKANQKEREKLAMIWVEKGLLAFSTVLYTKDKDFKDGEFYPPQIVTKENGETIITLWTSVMKRKKEYHNLEFRFTKDGNLLES